MYETEFQAVPQGRFNLEPGTGVPGRLRLMIESRRDSTVPRAGRRSGIGF